MYRNLSEALQAYNQRLPKGKKERFKARQELLDFVGAPAETVQRWLSGKAVPLALRALKCTYFLQGKGFLCKQLAELQPHVYLLGRLMALDRIGLEQACNSLGYTSQDALLAVLRGNSRPAKSSLVKWQELLRDQTDEKFWQEIRGEKVLGVVQEADYDQSSDPLRRQAALVVFNHQVLAMLPLAEYVFSDKFSDEERRRLREAIPDDGLFVLSNALQALCSKKARELALGQGLFKKKGGHRGQEK
jgi:hypothetical protein